MSSLHIRVHVDIVFDAATISAEEAEARVHALFDNAIENDSGILTDGGAVIDSIGDVYVEVT